MSENLFEKLTRTAADQPLILGTPDGSGSLSHGDLVAMSGRFANALVARGVLPGDRVAVQAEKSVAVLAVYLATLRIGAIYLPLNTGYTLAEMSYLLGDAQPALVVCDPSQAEALHGIVTSIAAIETLDSKGQGSLSDLSETQNADFQTVARDGDDIAAILYTSGTTGRPKGAMLSHANLSSNAETLRNYWQFKDGDVLLHALPIYHAHGLFVATNLVLLTGASMCFLPKFDANEVLALLPNCTVMMGVPTFYTRLLAKEGLGAASKGMRLFISGSAPLLPETHRSWQAVTGHRILERYGMTETCMLTSNPYEGARVPGSVGMALPGVELRVTDVRTGAVLSDGEVGMIEVHGPNVFKGYWRMPEKTASEFRADGFFITGDLGVKSGDGYVQIVGRSKDLVITGGLNVYPREVEAEIDEIEGVVESAVIGLPHPDFGEAVTAIVIAAPGAALTEASILSQLSSRISKFKTPKRVIFQDTLPRNGMGKVQKNLLRDQYKGLYRAALHA